MSQISHRHIEVFRAVMTAGSLTEAAALLHSSQPTLSRELARLEHLLGYALFDRQRSRLKATARALALFEEVERSYLGLQRVVDRAQELGRAEGSRLAVLCLPALSHALLPGAIGALLQRHPGAELSITPQESPLLEEWMGAQRFDLGLSEQGLTPSGTRSLPVFQADEVCVLPAGHALANRRRLRLRDFEAQDFISLSPEDPYRMQLDAMFDAAGVKRHLHVETHSAVAVCAMVQQGLGVAIVNPLTALACAGPRLQLRAMADSVPFKVNALLPEYRPAQPLAREMIECLRAEGERLSLALQSAFKG